MKEEIDPQDDWRLENFKVERVTYGDDAGQYKGTIQFANGQYEYFVFRISVDETKAYIDVIAPAIIRHASSLGGRLLKSMGLEKEGGEDE